MIYHTGLPFSVVDNNTALGNYSGALLAIPIGGQQGQPTSCGESNAGPGVAPPCLNANAFVNGGAATFVSYSGFSPQTRNQYRAPGFFDLDMNFFRTFALKEKMKLAIGLQAFNLFNHPNFGAPDNGMGDSTFGQISGMVGVPTSPYGNFLGFDSSPRVAQLTAKLVF
jgi:hypothetical protein